MMDVSASGHYTGDCRDLLRKLPDGCVQTCVTSPPYFGLRDYGHPAQIGLEPTPALYVAALVDVFREVRRVLRDDGTLWLNLGDCYAGSGRGGYAGGKSSLQGSVDGQDQSRVARCRQAGMHNGAVITGAIGRRWVPAPPGLKDKDLVGIPWEVAFALRADGWWLRQDVIWSKPNPMPESVTDRCTKAHEYLFLLSKSANYFFDGEAIAEPSTWAGQNRSSRAPAATQVPGAPPPCRSAQRQAIRQAQPPLRLDRRIAAVRRRALRDVPAQADRALHPRRLAAGRPGARPVLRQRYDRAGRREARPALDRLRPRLREAGQGAHGAAVAADDRRPVPMTLPYRRAGEPCGPTPLRARRAIEVSGRPPTMPGRGVVIRGLDKLVDAEEMQWREVWADEIAARGGRP